MKKIIIDFLRAAFPFLLTVGLWRLSVPFWNPAGILALIPIFFCSFIRPVKWFGLFSCFMCIVIDYSFETTCFWLAMYCLFSAINGFQSFIDLTHTNKDGLYAYILFLSCCLLIQFFAGPSFINLVRILWIIIWSGILYIPITTAVKKVHK